MQRISLPTAMTQAALVALDPTSGRLRAWVGGFDFATSHFDHVLRAQRQSGSAIKPLLYSAALEHDVMPDTVINDAELKLAGASGEGAWQPRNHDDRYEGPRPCAKHWPVRRTPSACA